MRWAGDDDDGSSPVEFVLVGGLLTALTLGVLQLGMVVYVRNVVHDAAVEGAYVAALADTELAEGVERFEGLVAATVGADLVDDVTVRETTRLGAPVVELTVAATLPVVGLFGVPGALEVTGHAPVESFDR